MTEANPNNKSGWTGFVVEILLKRGVALKLLLAVFAAIYIGLTFFNHPSADDFDYANKTIEQGFWTAQCNWYTEWSGRYCATAAISLYAAVTHPSGLFIKAYMVVPLTLMSLTFISMAALIRSAAGKLLTSKELFWATFILFGLYITSMPSIGQGFYWLSGAATYQLGNITAMLLVSLLLGSNDFSRFSMTKKIVWVVLIIVLALAAVGSNETIMSILLVILLTGTVYTFLSKSRASNLWKLALIAAVAGAFIAVIAPGNWIRQAKVPICHRFWYSVFKAVYVSARSTLSWMLQAEILAAGLLIIPWAKTLRKRGLRLEHISKRLFALLVILWLSLLALSFFPSLWATNNIPPLRAINTIYLVFLIGFFGLVFVSVQLVPEDRLHSVTMPAYLSAAVNAVLILAIFWNGHFISRVKDLCIRAPAYSQQLNKRYTTISNSLAEGRRDISVEMLKGRYGQHQVLPEIFFDDITTDFQDWRNLSYSRFFGLDSIAVKKQD